MNTIHLIDTEYIRGSRTIDVILVKPKDKKRDEKLVYLYNYEGIDFSIFSSLIDLSNFLCGKDYKILAEFEKNKDVDEFLVNTKNFLTN